MKVRIRFTKHGAMKFVGHLDLMRYFQKAFRRAHLPIKYSEGYHPHQIMSAAAPLGCGITSDGEYLDIELETPISTKEALEIINNSMVEGMCVTSFRELPDNSKNAMSSLAAASYEVRYGRFEKDAFANYMNAKLIDADIIKAKKEEFFDNANSIIIEKPTKKSTRELDLKPHIYNFEIDSDDDGIFYKLFLATGSEENIKPELVLLHFHNFIGIDPKDYYLQVHRLDMFTLIDDDYVSLGSIGNEISCN